MFSKNSTGNVVICQILSMRKGSFSIESVYSKLAVEDLKNLVNKHKDNSPVMTIIRARVRSYLYNNYVEVGDRHRIGKALRLDMGNSKIANNSVGIRKLRK